MNDLIKKLASQANFGSLDKDGEVVFDKRLEKFAELIVKECAGLFPMTFTDEQYQRRIDKTIKKHFGVE